MLTDTMTSSEGEEEGAGEDKPRTGGLTAATTMDMASCFPLTTPSHLGGFWLGAPYAKSQWALVNGN